MSKRHYVVFSQSSSFWGREPEQASKTKGLKLHFRRIGLTCLPRRLGKAKLSQHIGIGSKMLGDFSTDSLVGFKVSDFWEFSYLTRVLRISDSSNRKKVDAEHGVLL